VLVTITGDAAGALPAKAVEANRLTDIRAMSPKRLAKILFFIEVLLLVGLLALTCMGANENEK
jgi:hypothetical protein